ncbi:ABC transporter permease [Leucobacter luti]|uniref:Osmoprotectant transport system permease protein n=1 Tax=Leucobacter luti TaxID=340320 RepID=A0A4R6S7F4_9MICO|nr:ABC transporter permease subunit [Leucobacter luti]MCW2288633.1 osmoprotectant transport system permease protein [Leucobacter luti]QYM75441.1 ABC transporter permease subunit [Leucobacter luti]TCK45210.1 osmoprotectant transport system permease protein [Leucobacter luti]TDP95740.1 osmoprotectant transport system permease protein [Leucobacter luti]
MNWPLANLRVILEAAGDHLLLSVPAIVLSVLIAIPIGRLAFRAPRLGRPLLSVAALAYAIPALPLLILIPTLLGTPLRSWQTMVIALTVYGVALLVRTACDAFAAIDPQLRDAAVAVGYSPRAMFWRVDLPLAIPVLISGIRVVTVSTISLVTIGALIGVPSLGTLLTDGFQRGIAAEIWSGVIATVVLALLLDAVVLGIGRALTPWTRRATASAQHEVAVPTGSSEAASAEVSS